MTKHFKSERHKVLSVTKYTQFNQHHGNHGNILAKHENLKSQPIMTLQLFKENYFLNILQYALSICVNKKCVSVMRRHITQKM